jgi:hypothetical protein
LLLKNKKFKTAIFRKKPTSKLINKKTAGTERKALSCGFLFVTKKRVWVKAR